MSQRSRNVLSRAPWAMPLLAVLSAVFAIVALAAVAGNLSPAVPAPVPLPQSTAADRNLRIQRATSPIAIDGNLDDWANVPALSIDASSAGFTSGAIAGPLDLSAAVRAVWDDQYLYVSAVISDNILIADSSNIGDDDSIEIAIDGDHDGRCCGAFDHQYTVAVDGRLADFGSVVRPNAARVQLVVRQDATPSGYHVEMAIPLVNLTSMPVVSGTVMGFNIGLNDDDDGGRRDKRMVWSGSSTADFASFPTLAFVGEAPAAPTATPSAVATPTVTKVVYTSPPPGFYEQYDWPCPWPLVAGTLPNGTKLPMCQSGMNDRNEYISIDAFRTAGGMDWGKAKQYSPDPDVQTSLRLGSIFWISWQDLNPGQGSYNWQLIDNYIAAAKSLTMDTPSGPQPKGVYIRIFNAISTRPAGNKAGGPIDEGFMFDDETPTWVKGKMGGTVAIPPSTVDANGKKTGQVVTRDDGSYWVRTPCVYTDLKASKYGGNNWNAAYWVVPKYDNPVWQGAAYQMLTDVAKHYDGSNVSFIFGINGMDGEYGNWLTNSFAGCEGLRAAFTAQYGKGNSDMDVRELPQAYAKGTTSRTAMFSCSSDCDATWFGNLGFGLFQARAVDDGPNYHRSGDIGVLDEAVLFGNAGKPVGWENAYPKTDTNYVYPMLSVIQPSWPDFFSLVGGSWSTDPNLLREFLPLFGQSITTTQVVWWRAYWTCYGYEVVCPTVGAWTSFLYSGWLKNIEVGITTTAYMSPVVTTELTGAQQTQPWSKMLRRATGTVPFYVDPLWPVVGPYTVTVRFVDSGVGTLSLAWSGGSVSLPRSGSTGGLLETRTTSIPTTKGLALVVGGNAIYLHDITIGTIPAAPAMPTPLPTAIVTPSATPTPAPHTCSNYWTNCVSGATCPSGTARDLLGSCVPGYICCLPVTPGATATAPVAATPTAPVTPAVTPTLTVDQMLTGLEERYRALDELVRQLIQMLPTE